MKHPHVVSRAEWQAAHEALLAKEKAATRARDALAAERRQAANAIKNLTAGDTIALPEHYPIRAFEFLRKDKSVVIARGSDGVTYRLRPKILAVATITKASSAA